MKSDVRSFLAKLLVLTDDEKEFMRAFSKGVYIPELLFDNDEIIRRVKKHPMALWKIKNS